MRNESTPRLLHNHRNAGIYLERSRVYVDDSCVVYSTKNIDNIQTFNIPYGNISVIFLGHGTSITHEAMVKLGEENVFIAATGTGWSPLHYGSLSNYHQTKYFNSMVDICRDDNKKLIFAKQLCEYRCDVFENNGIELTQDLFGIIKTVEIDRAISTFRKNIEKSDNIESLMGYEGVYAKSLYAAFAKYSGINDFKRDKENKNSPSVNSMISHGNYLAYGFSGATLWVLGIPSQLSVIHGKTRAGGLVFDLADTYKESYVLPLSFAYGSGRLKGDDASFRERLMRMFEKNNVMKINFDIMGKVVDA